MRSSKQLEGWDDAFGLVSPLPISKISNPIVLFQCILFSFYAVAVYSPTSACNRRFSKSISSSSFEDVPDGSEGLWSNPTVGGDEGGGCGDILSEGGMGDGIHIL